MSQLFIPFAEEEVRKGLVAAWNDHIERQRQTKRGARGFAKLPSPAFNPDDFAFVPVIEIDDPEVPEAQADACVPELETRTNQDVDQAPRLAPASEPETELHQTEWNDSDIIQLHAYVLQRQLEILCQSTKTSDPEVLKDRRDIWRWVCEPRLVRATRQSDGAEVHAYLDQWPFSYSACCRAAGVDADELREQVAKRLPDMDRLLSA